MHVGVKRGRAVAVVVLVAVVAAVGSAVTTWFTRPEKVVHLTAQAQVASDGSARITETIGYHFTGLGKHGIFRVVPGLNWMTPGVTATKDGHPSQLDDEPNQTDTVAARLRLGDPDHTITGNHV